MQSHFIFLFLGQNEVSFPAGNVAPSANGGGNTGGKPGNFYFLIPISPIQKITELNFQCKCLNLTYYNLCLSLLTKHTRQDITTILDHRTFICCLERIAPYFFTCVFSGCSADRDFCTTWVKQEWCEWGDNMSLTYNGEKGTPYSFCPHKCGQC